MIETMIEETIMSDLMIHKTTASPLASRGLDSIYITIVLLFIQQKLLNF